MKPILLLTSKYNDEVQRYLEAAEHLDIALEHILFEDLSLTAKNSDDFLSGYHRVITRISPHESNEQHFTLRQMLCESTHGDKILNSQTYKRFAIFNKLDQLRVLAAANLPIPVTVLGGEPVTLPIILKGLLGSNGNAVHYLTTQDEFTTNAALYGANNYLLQEVLPIGEDYRVVVLGTKAIAMHKKITQSAFLTNISAGGKAVAAETELQEQLGELAVKTAQACGCEYGGVDIMLDSQKQPRVLEVNRAPGMSILQEEIWHINLPETVLTYLTQ